MKFIPPKDRNNHQFDAHMVAALSVHIKKMCIRERAKNVKTLMEFINFRLIAHTKKTEPSNNFWIKVVWNYNFWHFLNFCFKLASTMTSSKEIKKNLATIIFLIEEIPSSHWNEKLSEKCDTQATTNVHLHSISDIGRQSVNILEKKSGKADDCKTSLTQLRAIKKHQQSTPDTDDDELCFYCCVLQP
jgi:hypothetical protein